MRSQSIPTAATVVSLLVVASLAVGDSSTKRIRKGPYAVKEEDVFKPADVTADMQIRAARALIGRITPSLVDHFDLSLIPQEAGQDVYELEQEGSKVALRGNNGVSLASAYNHYLREFCKCHYSLWGDQMALPKTPPVVPSKIRKGCAREVRHFFNYCTFGYTAPWWDWEQWERMIDILAINGVNMPLNTVGAEAVWYHTSRELGLTDLESRKFLSAPPYLNWQWMSCLDGTYGPLPKGFVDSHLKLGRQIMQRELSLGMQPIVHGFTGHVPLIFREKFPDENIIQKHSWAGFVGTAKADPTSPFFQKVGEVYLKNQIRLLGTGHYYIADPFQESKPPTGVDHNMYLRNTGRSISSLITGVDPKGVWVSQDWSMFYPMWDAVDKDKLLVMNLNGIRWRRYKHAGYRFTVGQLNNFGGRTFMHGDLRSQANDFFAWGAKESPNCVGFGNWTEGINDNPVNYHLTLEMNWANGPIDLKKWIETYSESRYGANKPAFAEAWDLLLKGLYNRGAYGFSTMVAARPGLNPPKSGPNRTIKDSHYYDTKDLAKAWGLLLSTADDCKDSAGFRFDLADWGRQCLSNLAAHRQRAIARAFYNKDRDALAKAGKEFGELLDDIDELISSCPQMLMGKWQADAASWATTEEEKAYYLSMGATFVTIWGRDALEQTRLYDYAWREWGGLVKTFYKKRWEIFVQELDRKIVAGEEYHDPANIVWGRPAFRGDEIHSKIAEFEDAYASNPPEMPSKAQGDTVAIARKLWKKYSAELLSLPAGYPKLRILPASLTSDKPVTCSGAIKQYPAHQANDGNPNTFWAMDAGNDDPAWWQVDLRELMTVGRVAVVGYYGDERHYGFTVQTSPDGKTWTMVADRRDNRAPSTKAGYGCVFKPHKARFIRVTLTHNSANTGRHLVEVMAYAK